MSAQKSFVTSAGEADSYVVSARKAGAAGPTESNLYLISKGTAGFTVQGRFEGLGLAGNASAPMTLTDVAVDDETRLGPEGSGFQSMLEVVLPHFQIGVASVSVGIATAAFQTIVAHVGARKYEHAGGAALASIPRVQFLVAEMALELNSARAYLGETIRKALGGDPAAMLDVLGVKVKAADACLNVVSRAMTLGGGWAFGRRGGLERNFRDAQAAAVMAPSKRRAEGFHGQGLPRLALVLANFGQQYLRNGETMPDASRSKALRIGAVAYDPKVVTIWEGFKDYFAASRRGDRLRPLLHLRRSGGSEPVRRNRRGLEFAAGLGEEPDR